ncbi:NAD(P)-dependent oxidoreductase [Lacticigenium naphthae]|uniref:NAD(P)-dependent oxidoreductase n=1 Tax=Lacticigenium naphthae TaxID=515351 RepID=UPI0004271BA1|nr:NAD(P)-dependent oxidoreductase [Lacticigenium naphthae]
MTNKQIGSYRKLTREQEKSIKQVAPGYEIVQLSTEKSPDPNVEILYGWNKTIGSHLEEKAPNLKWVQASSAGVDYFPQNYFQENGILLTNASGIHRKPIAESVIGMLLFHTRGIGKAHANQLQSKWNDQLTVQEVHDKIILIVGSGEIGQEVGKLAKNFGMHTIGINRSGEKAPFMDEQYTQKTIGKYLNQADYVINILPLTKETHYFFNRKLFENMKENSVFVNVGRGLTVNTKELIEALDKQIGFAALDVFEEEPLPESSELWHREDVLILPHITGNLEDYEAALFPIFLENLTTFVEKGNVIKNKVDFNKGY